MIQVSIFTNEIRPDGELVDRLAVAFEVSGQTLNVTEGNAQFLQVGIPVYSERYGRLIDFDTDGEEWARNLPSAYRNGAVNMSVKEVIAAGAGAGAERSAYAYALPQMQQRR